MAKPTPIGRDAASRNYAALIAAIESIGTYGRPETQSTSDGAEKLVHCPLCIAAGKGEGHRKHLRIAKRSEGGSTPYVGCRVHGEPGDWARIRSALVSAGVPAELLASGGSAGSSASEAGEARSEPRRDLVRFKPSGEGLGESDPIPNARIDKWAGNLWSPKGRKYLDFLIEERGLEEAVIKEAQIGVGAFRWTPGKRKSNRITIPIFNADGECVNVRLYSAQPGKGPKMLPYPHPTLLNKEGKKYQTYAKPTRLYGVDDLATDSGVDLDDGKDPVRYVFVCAGEWDRLLLSQEGLLTVTGTGAEKTLPREEDCEYLVDRDVVVIYDCDEAGRSGAMKFARAALAIGAKTVRIIDLDPDRDDGYDISDFLLGSEGDDAIDRLIDLVEEATPLDPADYSDEGEDGIPSNDTEAARLLLRRHGEDMRYVDTGPKAGYWIVWDGKAWRKDLDGLSDRWVVEVGEEFLPAARQAYSDAQERGDGVGVAGAVLRRVQSLGDHGRIRATLDRAKTVVPGMVIQPEELDNEPTMLGVGNGTLVLGRTGADLQSASRTFRLTLNTRTNFVPDRRDPVWTSFLRTFIPDTDLREFLQRVAGYSLLGGNPEGLLFTLDGPTRTGKSTFLGAMDRALGDYSSPFDLTAFRGKFDAGPREDVASIMGARFAYVSEVNGAFELHADQIKRLTGQDKIAFNRKYEHQQTRYPDFTALIAANGKPRVKGADKALHGRICTIPFLVSMPTRSRKAEALRSESVNEAVLAWAVAGYGRYAVDGVQADTWPQTVVEATLGTLSALDDIDDFLGEACEIDADFRWPTKDFYPAYRSWCSESGVKRNDILSRQMFGESLTDRGYPQRGVRIEGKKVKSRLGIRLKDGWAGVSFSE